MIRRALLLTLAMTGLASAQPAAPPADPPPVARMTQPAGWILDPPGGTRVAAGLGADGLFAGAPIGVDAQVWTAPSHHAVLVTTQVSTDRLPADPDAAANATLHEIRAGADAVDGAAIDRWMVVVDPAGKLHEATLTWRDPSVGTTTIVRALVFRTGGALARIAGECVIGLDGAADRAACEAALATIAPNATALEPVKVTAEAPAAAEPAAEPMPAAGSGATLGSGAPPSLRDGADVPATVMVRPPTKQADRRPLYLVAGIAVLALVFLWNRRERQRREAAERAEEARRNRRRGKASDDDEAVSAADGDAADGADDDGAGDEADDAAADDAGDAAEVAAKAAATPDAEAPPKAEAVADAKAAAKDAPKAEPKAAPKAGAKAGAKAKHKPKQKERDS